MKGSKGHSSQLFNDSESDEEDFIPSDESSPKKRKSRETFKVKIPARKVRTPGSAQVST